MVVIKDGKPLATFAPSIAGLMSQESVDDVADKLK